MAKHRSKQKFSAIWATQTQLGEHFSMTAKEIGQKLSELGLRIYDEEQRQYVPTPQALADGLCTYTPLKSGKPFYMWHKAKISKMMQEKTQIKPLSDKDVEYREMALSLLELDKDAEKGFDKAYYLFFDSLSPKDIPTILAWALIEAHKESVEQKGKADGTAYQRLRDGIEAKDFPAINSQLERLGADIRLGEHQDTSNT